MSYKDGICSDYCKGCGHFTRVGGTYYPMCNYILDTGHRRPCPGGDGCTEHTKLTRAQVRSRRVDIVIQKDPPPKTHGPLPIISDAAMLAEFRRGASDKEMMETFGVSLHTVKKKRQKMGLFRAPQKKKKQRMVIVQKTRIEWADATWNPVTGCLHGCEYCYARRIAERFKGCDLWSTYGEYHQATWRRVNPGSASGEALFEIDEKCPPINVRFNRETQKEVHTKAPYPWGFQPTLHRERMSIPERWKKPLTIFVCSMSDLFGNWVPAEWIGEVFKACKAAPQHRYLFLTKNPGRFCGLERAAMMPHDDNFWFGATYDHCNWIGDRVNGRAQVNRWHDAGDYYFPMYPEKHRFVSFEPLLSDIGANIGSTGGEWHIIGAETGNRKGKVSCKREWVDHIVTWSDAHGVPVFMKDSLIPIVGEENMRREFPWKGELRDADKG